MEEKNNNTKISDDTKSYLDLDEVEEILKESGIDVDNTNNADNDEIDKEDIDDNDSDSSEDIKKKEEKKTEKKKKTGKKTSKKQKKLKKAAYVITMTILICIFLGSAAYLINYFWQAKKVDNKSDELKDIIADDAESDDYTVVESVTDDNDNKIDYVIINGVKVQKKFARIYEENNDFIGWLAIDDTVIDYPVMQTPYDEEYYLHRDFDKQYIGNGTLFADTDSDISKPSDNIIIYGHNMKNGRMFHEILSYDNEDFYKEHKYIEFDTIFDDGKYEVIAAFTTKVYDDDYTGFRYHIFFDAETEEDFDYFVESCKNLTPYDIPTTAVYGDKLITLSTCATSDDAGRFVVVAKKIE